MVRKLPLCGLLLAATALDCQLAWGADLTHTDHGHNPAVKGHTAVRHAEGARPVESLSVSARRNVSHGTEQRMGQKVMQQFVAGTNPMKILAARTPGLRFC